MRVEAVTKVVAIEQIRRVARLDELAFEFDGHRRFTRTGEASEPNRHPMLTGGAGASLTTHGRRVPSGVCALLGFVLSH
ncbi:MAG: hypothetical protein R2706_16300 [Acidimicrobiales bacterium]